MRKQLAFEGASCPHVEVRIAPRRPARRAFQGAGARIDEILIAASLAGATLVGSLMIADVIRAL